MHNKKLSMSKALHSWSSPTKNKFGFSCSTCKICGLSRQTNPKFKITQYTTSEAKFNIAPSCKHPFIQMNMF